MAGFSTYKNQDIYTEKGVNSEVKYNTAEILQNNSIKLQRKSWKSDEITHEMVLALMYTKKLNLRCIE